MTYLERTMQPIQLMPLILALAIVASLVVGIVIGGPVLHLGAGTPARDVTISQATRANGQAWEEQRRQQRATYSLVDAGTIQSGADWEAQRQAQTPSSR